MSKKLMEKARKKINFKSKIFKLIANKTPEASFGASSEGTFEDILKTTAAEVKKSIT